MAQMHMIPRETKGEGKILYIFSPKAMTYTAVCAISAFTIFYTAFSIMGMQMVGLIITLIFGAIGFAIGTFKVPDTTAFEITKKTGGENIDDVIRRGIKFKMQKNKIYVYENDINEDIEKEETKDE